MKMKLKLALFTLFLLSFGDLALGFGLHQRNIKNECPAKENIPKCSCTYNTQGLTVICKAFVSDDDFQSHLKNLRGYTVKKLVLSHYVVSDVPEDLWKGLEIDELSFSYVEIKDPTAREGQRDLLGLEKSLTVLEIRNSFKLGHSPLVNLQLDHLKNLKHVILEDNNIPEVGNDWFTTGPEALRTLIFERNGIKELGDRAFKSLNNLKILAVAGNHLNSISRSMLPESPKLLTTLDLAYNKIRTLPKDIFSGMPMLADVNLDYNLIHMIRQDTWGSISSQITSLTLKGNGLQCDKDMEWICDTNLRSARGKCMSPAEKKGLPLEQFCKV